MDGVSEVDADQDGAFERWSRGIVFAASAAGVSLALTWNVGLRRYTNAPLGTRCESVYPERVTEPIRSCRNQGFSCKGDFSLSGSEGREALDAFVDLVVGQCERQSDEPFASGPVSVSRRNHHALLLDQASGEVG